MHTCTHGEFCVLIFLGKTQRAAWMVEAVFIWCDFVKIFGDAHQIHSENGLIPRRLETLWESSSGSWTTELGQMFGLLPRMTKKDQCAQLITRVSLNFGKKRIFEKIKLDRTRYFHSIQTWKNLCFTVFTFLSSQTGLQPKRRHQYSCIGYFPRFHLYGVSVKRLNVVCSLNDFSTENPLSKNNKILLSGDGALQGKSDQYKSAYFKRERA